MPTSTASPPPDPSAEIARLEAMYQRALAEPAQPGYDPDRRARLQSIRGSIDAQWQLLREQRAQCHAGQSRGRHAGSVPGERRRH